jgi:CO/xanthine dehydrogenase FAD-binding subunit
VAGAVAEIPQEITAVEQQARGSRLSGKLIDDIAQAYADAIEPLSDLRGSAWYRKQIIRVLARRAMEQLSPAN